MYLYHLPTHLLVPLFISLSMNIALAISYWIHLLGIVIWVGVSLLMPLVINPVLQALEPPARAKFMATWSPKAAPIINISILLVIASGIAQIPLKFGTWNVFGLNIFTIKLFVAALMMANGVYLGVVLAGKLAKLAPTPGTPPSPEFLKTQRMLEMHSKIQAGLAVLVLLTVGLLTA